MVATDFVEMMESTPTCILIHDAVTLNILWANPAACGLLGFSLTEIRPLKSIHMSSSAEQYNRVIAQAWLRVAAERGSNRIEWHYRSKSGRVIPTDAVATRIELAQGTAVMVQFRDVERSPRIEQELRLTTSYVAALAQHTSTMAIMLDGNGTIRFVTDSLLDRLGAVHETADTRDAAVAALSTQTTLRADGRVVSWLQAVLLADPTVALRLQVPTQSGTAWFEGSIERLKSADDGLLLLLHDATDRIESEARLAREQQQENYLARYNAMGDMAMAIAHELGQPLAAARNFLVGLRTRTESLRDDEPVPASVRHQLSYGVETSLNQIERASSIVSAARRFVSHLEIIEQVVDLNAIVEECLHFIRLRATPGFVEVDVRLHDQPVLVRCERVLTGQVIMNLCFNAVDEMLQCPRDTRQIVLTTLRRDGQGIFSVDDQGRGLPQNPFEGAFTSKAGGSGIGLALSYRIITRQHGSIRAENRPEGGTRFTFGLPLADAERKATDAANHKGNPHR